MKITRTQLRKLINEHMLAPTFWHNREKRMSLLFRILDDPNVNPKLKKMLHSENESEINQAVQMIAALYPEYAEEIDLYNSRQDSIEYWREFERERERRQFDSASLKEAMYDPLHGMKSLEEPGYSKVMNVIDNPDASEEDLKNIHTLGDTISGYEDPRPGMPDDSLAGVERQNREFARAGAQQIEAYLPGFMNLPQPMIDAVTEFVFLSKGPKLHLQLEEETLEDEIGQDMYDRATLYPSRNQPENADAVKIVDSYRNNPKAHDPKFYSIYATGVSTGKDPFSKIDPYLDPKSQYPVHRTGDAQTGFHDGFREEYHKVTEEPKHRISSYAVEEDIIRMMRDLRPDHQEYVIN